MYSNVKPKLVPTKHRLRYIRKTRVFVLEPCQDDHSIEDDVNGSDCNKSTTRSILEEFLKKTTIPGLSQLGGNKRWFSRVLWIGLFVTGIAMAIYQSRSLIEEYRRYAVNERSVREIQWSIGFPSVTVCINSPIRWFNYSSDPGLTLMQNIESKFELIPDIPLQSFSEAGNPREKLLMEELSKLNETQRIEVGYPLKMFIIICTWGDLNCSWSDYTIFNNLYYGNCFTFNSGFSKSSRKQGPKSQSLNVVLRSNFRDSYPYSSRDDGLVMLVHPPGSAPILDQRRVLNLFPGRWLKIGISKTVFYRLPPPFSSRCTENKLPTSQAKSLFFTKDRPYTYTMDACTESCLQNLSIQLCNCILPHLPLPPNPPSELCKNLRCDVLNNESASSMCTCSKPCRDTIYDLRIDADDRWLNQIVWQEWVENALNNETSPYIDIKRVVGFEVYIASSLVETILEEPKISLADFLGSLGGNLGLWVGISIISMVELVEVTGKIVIHNGKQIFKRKAVQSSK